MSASRPEIRLYTYAMSPYSAKVHCFLLYKQLDFEPIYVNPLHVREELPVGHKIPVLEIDGESRPESSAIGLWLDERFPETPPLLPADADRERLLALDEWVSERLIPSSFRSFPGAGLDRFRNGWKLARVMGRTARGGLPVWLRFVWPVFVTRAPFIRRLVAQADDGLPIAESRRKLCDAFVMHLDGGPFLGGRSDPSLPDFSAYPQFALYWAVGFHGAEAILEFPELMAWLARMRPLMSGDPPLLPPHVRLRDLP